MMKIFMIKLPYRKSFCEIPNISHSELAEYFTVELGRANGEYYHPNDFKYIGLFVIDGYEQMRWSCERSDSICAIVRPFDDSYIIEMGAALT